jgi:A nuclease family of the HNH/ENDO VII superfamily with conserved AHH
LIDAATAKRLAEQQKILREAQDARRELFEVAQGRPSSRALGVALEASGVPRPEGYAAHHITAGADPRAEIARGVLEKFGIGINDVVNGVFLPANRATQVIAGETIHAPLHTKDYYDAVNEALKKATTKQEVIDILRDIGQALQAGDYP